MVQDMFDPEYYLGVYEVRSKSTNETSLRCGKYREDTVECKVLFLPPATKLRQGNVFTPVCHSVHRGGVCHTPPGQTPPAQCMLGYTPLPSACWDTPPCTVHAGIRSTSGRYASHWNAFFLYQHLLCGDIAHIACITSFDMSTYASLLRTLLQN